MAIGLSNSALKAFTIVMIVLAAMGLTLRGVADDQIVKTNGQVSSGKITKVEDGQLWIEINSNGSSAKFPIRLTDIKSITMATPDAVAKAEAPGTPPATVISTLEPAIAKFAGLNTEWVLDAMGRLAQAYADSGKAAKATEIYNQIDTLYPGSKYHAQAVAGKAEISLKAGKINEALAAVQPVIDEANKDLAPSPEVGAVYARTFLVYGDILVAQKKPQQALEAYLTVSTMLYQDPTLADDATKRAQALRDQNPGLGVE
jgi:tetratricopeptide (TPR) repeat protein